MSRGPPLEGLGSEVWLARVSRGRRRMDDASPTCTQGPGSPHCTLQSWRHGKPSCLHPGSFPCDLSLCPGSPGLLSGHVASGLPLDRCLKAPPSFLLVLRASCFPDAAQALCRHLILPKAPEAGVCHHPYCPHEDTEALRGGSGAPRAPQRVSECGSQAWEPVGCKLRRVFPSQTFPRLQPHTLGPRGRSGPSLTGPLSGHPSGQLPSI